MILFPRARGGGPDCLRLLGPLRLVPAYAGFLEVGVIGG